MKKLMCSYSSILTFFFFLLRLRCCSDLCEYRFFSYIKNFMSPSQKLLIVLFHSFKWARIKVDSQSDRDGKKCMEWEKVDETACKIFAASK